MKQKFSLFSNIRRDGISGLIVFLIALPLCLGIAQASNAPLFSGIVAGIVGGLVVGSLSGSNLSVTGPAAGLTAIVLTALGELGAFDIFLCSVIVAGAVQFLLGMLKAGSIANYFPTSVIEGMLAGIGLTIIIKQVPEAIGYSVPEEHISSDADDGFKADFITTAFQHVELGALIIAVLGLSLLILWQTKAFKKLSLVPSGLLVVLIGTLINEGFRAAGSPLFLGAEHLVKLPVASTPTEFIDQFVFPDLSGFSNPKVWQTGVVIAIVASIETLLCIEATDKLDELKRYTPTNRELRAQGIGNIVSGLIGGLPLTSVIVRSSANINAGARTKLSTIIHGTLLLLCVAAIPVLLNKIPKASLAVILIFTGYKLCNPKVFKHIWKEGGVTQFIPFVATAVAVVSLDLLKGVGIGLIISILYLLRNNMRIPYYYNRSTYSNGDIIKLTLAQEVSFLNKASIKETLANLPENSSVIIDATHTEYIDFDVLDLIREFHNTKAQEKGIKTSLVGFKNTYKIPESSTRDNRAVVAEYMGNNENPNRSAGGYRKLLQQLTNGGSKNSDNEIKES
ncbi:MAG: SulP family inorganic anion transporter [Chitinophagaceae bacterium]|nr:MAG: SulP family inorganic anion transporter [Chitinophagaceae bacterium]